MVYQFFLFSPDNSISGENSDLSMLRLPKRGKIKTFNENLNHFKVFHVGNRIFDFFMRKKKSANCSFKFF